MLEETEPVRTVRERDTGEAVEVAEGDPLDGPGRRSIEANLVEPHRPRLGAPAAAGSEEPDEHERNCETAHAPTVVRTVISRQRPVWAMIVS